MSLAVLTNSRRRTAAQAQVRRAGAVFGMFRLLLAPGTLFAYTETVTADRPQGATMKAQWEVHSVVDRGVVVERPAPFGGHRHLIEWDSPVAQIVFLN